MLKLVDGLVKPEGLEARVVVQQLYECLMQELKNMEASTIDQQRLYGVQDAINKVTRVFYSCSTGETVKW